MVATLWLQGNVLFQSCQVINTRTSREAGQVTHKAQTVGLRDPGVGARAVGGEFGVHTLVQGLSITGMDHSIPNRVLFS